MAKNRHNGVHTDNPSGKADYVIAGLLSMGKKNAISTKELVQLSGCSSARELQIYIAQERKAACGDLFLHRRRLFSSGQSRGNRRIL